MSVRDLSHVAYWHLIMWRAGAAEWIDNGTDAGDDGHNRQWLAELNAELARRCEQMRGQLPPDGYDIEYSPMWQEGCNSHCLYEYRRAPWVETEAEMTGRKAWDAWFERDVAKIRASLAKQTARAAGAVAFDALIAER